MTTIPFKDLETADLVVDAIDQGDSISNTYGAEPIHHLPQTILGDLKNLRHESV